ncbi:hypothetical protein GCK72_024686 [Caenorhabditis remanei]|uniref:Uncharacterized protein n=1 Tax=Caenorhabditis remanei TaxID=31234 RepID=A0A6A5G101_CAERE|nr:hypothetical protein GCK72_024686 [Caenorhabditis remanei]KAF1748219.1 hypothetical protein GCK72_024686 [Caenorhabditis remanei]
MYKVWINDSLTMEWLLGIILRKRTSDGHTYIHFVTYAGSELVLGEVVADDMTLLSVSQISAILRYPLGKIISDRDIESQSSTKWWFIIIVLCAGLFLIGIGWFCLFLFFNTCGFMYGTDYGDHMTRAQRARMRKHLIIDTAPSQCEPAAEQPNDALPSDGSIPSEAAKKPRLNKKLQRSCRTLSEIHTERRIKKEQENIRKAIQDAFHQAVAENKKAVLEAGPLPSSFGPRAVDTENTDVETAQREVATKSEKKRRHTKIGPFTAVTTTTTTTNEQEGKTSEISGVSSVTTTSTQEMDEFDVSNLPETSLKITKKKKGQTDEAEIGSEPVSDYGSSLDDEKSKDEEEQSNEVHEEHRVRPMTAKKQRTSLFGGSGISPLPVQPRAWTVYQAGDRVAEFWNDKNYHSHPTPAMPTEDGMIQLRTSNSFNF